MVPPRNAFPNEGLIQNGTCYSDGVPGVTQYPILPGGNLTLRFPTSGQYGFYWYHSHTRGYYADGVRGPLLIRPSPGRPRPFSSIADNLQDVEGNATTLFVHDWYHITSDTLLAMYYTTGVYPSCFDSIVFNGKGAVQCLPPSVLQQANANSAGTAATVTVTSIMTSDAGPITESPLATATGDAMQMGSGPMGGIIEGGMGTTDQMALSPRGCSQPMMFKSGYDASFLNPEMCVNTSTPLETIYTGDAEWIAFNIVNAGVTAQLSFSLDSHDMWIYAADGGYVEPQKVQVRSYGTQLTRYYRLLSARDILCLFILTKHRAHIIFAHPLSQPAIWFKLYKARLCSFMAPTKLCQGLWVSHTCPSTVPQNRALSLSISRR
jgi:FtsP/CotA-like multicopper oxidase with cupredoxin domain